MSNDIENRNQVHGEFTIANPAVDTVLPVGFAVTKVELLNKTTKAHDVFQVTAASGEVEPLAATGPQVAVNYDSNNGGSEGGTLSGLAAGEGFTIKAALAGYNATADAGDVIQWTAVR